MAILEALAEMEENIFHKQCAASLLYCLGKAVQEDVFLANPGEAILGIHKLLEHLLERDITALENAFRAARGEA